jgi:hypothetical protein
MSVERLPDFALDDGRPLGREFAALGLGSYREAARYVRTLPYGRNTDRSDWRLVLREGRGACSTKHALLAELARENGRHVALMLGIYEMCEDNTPGIGAVLERHGLPCIPDAHCYLAHEGTRVDLKREVEGAEYIERFSDKEEVPGSSPGRPTSKKRCFAGKTQERRCAPYMLWSLCAATVQQRGEPPAILTSI